MTSSTETPATDLPAVAPPPNAEGGDGAPPGSERGPTGSPVADAQADVAPVTAADVAGGGDAAPDAPLPASGDAPSPGPGTPSESAAPDAGAPSQTASPDGPNEGDANAEDAGPPGEAATPSAATTAGPAAPGAPVPKTGGAAAPDCGPLLKKTFPALFAGGPKPLKLRIQTDIQERAPGVFSKQALSAFFRRYTGSTSYLTAVSRARHRFDLDGREAGELSEEHRKIALEELARRRGNQQSRIELEEQQRRNRATLLHDFERTTLTPANFCALKGIAVDELDGYLATARREAAERPLPPPAFDPGRRPGPERRPPRPAPGAPRRDGAPAGGARHGDGQAPGGPRRTDGPPRRGDGPPAGAPRHADAPPAGGGARPPDAPPAGGPRPTDTRTPTRRR